MKKKDEKAEQAPKKPAKEPARDDRKPYSAPKLTVHGSLGQITAGSGWRPTS